MPRISQGAYSHGGQIAGTSYADKKNLRITQRFEISSVAACNHFDIGRRNSPFLQPEKRHWLQAQGYILHFFFIFAIERQKSTCFAAYNAQLLLANSAHFTRTNKEACVFTVCVEH